jgi:hypothetical protein
MTLTQVELYHRELHDWKKSLLFYKDDLKVLTNRLTELVSKNTSKEVLSESEHFQNQFILQREQLDILSHDLEHQLKFMERSISPYTKRLGSEVLQKQNALRDRIDVAEKILRELKHDFYKLLAKNF